MAIPCVAPAIALVTLAKASELRRLHHCRRFLTFCGMNLSKQQVDAFRGVIHLLKHSNAKLRTPFRMAAQSAVRMHKNSFRRKFDRYVRVNSRDDDLRPKAYVTVAAKLARVAHGLVMTENDCRLFLRKAVTGWVCPLVTGRWGGCGRPHK
jgi:Transposase IS116/IS110/IS902 family